MAFKSAIAEVQKTVDRNEPAETLADEVHRAIPTASAQDLELLHDRLTAAWDAGEVDRDTAETLTRLLLNRSRQLQAPTQPQQRLDELFAVQSVVRVESRVLGEVVLWVRDETAIPPEAPEVAYTHNELKGLSGMAPEVLRAVHAAKKGLDGELIEAEPADTEHVYFSDLLAIPAGDDACPCCGKAPWWDNAGRRTCGVCHPNPRRAREALKTEPTTKEAVPHVA